MGLRDWFKTSSSGDVEDDAQESVAEQEAAAKRAFAELQATKTTEALSLFDEDDPNPVAVEPVEAPYDASEAGLEDLLSEVEESFTHANEVEIADVTDLDDPYMNAVIEGDLPQPVVFGDEEKTGSV